MRYILPLSILSGTIVGAGMFSLPFIFSSVGFLTGIFYLMIFSVVFWLTHAMYADIILRTDHEPHFLSYVKTYLGPWAYWPSVFATIISILLVLTIYIILAPSFAKLLDGDITETFVVYAFWALGSLMVFLDIKKLALLEFVTSAGIVLIILLVFLFGITGAKTANIDFFGLPSSLALFFLPFGPILFSLAGRSAIPSLLQDMRLRNIAESAASRIIFWGTVLPGLSYLLFVVGILGLSDSVSEDAVTGIVKAGKPLLIPLGILGLSALLSTYVPLGISVKNVLIYDFRMSGLVSGIIVVAAPILSYLFGVRNFLMLVALSGGIFLAFEGLTIALIWNKLNSLGKPRILLMNFGVKTAYLVAAIFAIGMIYEIINLIKGA